MSKYIYTLNSPTIFNDPSGEFVPAIYILAVVLGVVAGTISASLNQDAARKAGLSSSQAAWSAFFSFLYTAAAVSASVLFPALSPLFSGLASGATNMTNQLISNGGNWDKVNWDRVGASALVAAASDFAFGTVLSKFGVSSAVDRTILSSPFGAIGGYCIDFGFGSEAAYSCGLQTLNPPPKADDPSRPKGGQDPIPQGAY